MTKQNTSYTPIECGLHSEYELAIMHKTKCEISWKDSDKATQAMKARPIDLIVKDKQEFLKIKSDKNEIMEIRLDKIIYMKAL